MIIQKKEFVRKYHEILKILLALYEAFEGERLAL